MLNKYNSMHQRHVDLLVEYYNKHQEWSRKPTIDRSVELRSILSDLRRVQTEMRDEVMKVRRQLEEQRRIKKETQ